MPISAAFIEAHIARWEEELNRPQYPYRKKWPSRLFHHAPIENAVKIIQGGNLRSRNDPENNRAKDIAAAGVVQARGHAHDSARLYFRPRTPTQWHIEGIRKAGECKWEEAHAPVLVMMVFDARKVLCRPGIQFCDRNMQLGSAEPGDSEDYFSKIPFEKVYHEGGTGGDKSITDHRCAEVLAVSPLPLNETLQWIYCRTGAERDTLIHLLGPSCKAWFDYILVSDDLLVFERKFVFVEYVDLTGEGLVFKLRPRSDNGMVDFKSEVIDKAGNVVFSFESAAFSPRPPSTERWITKGKLPKGRYFVRLWLEGHLAYQNYHQIGDKLV
ncbi:DarT ssDNA thymidine ADP-ribosyltransferase family protein [Bradyrhizobium sp. th.b2]|uniref:DarT ssDNA thymidine ADP-ribosyltransferase family protein n=1 Tax=Bradyrhizobium sp. th-b2 TaxID=172088 RepID=UPI000A0713FB|nr:DarT ssDNA thymidine ADP-ribosyltransferase family protein [Bradyrhizobium sp. th.b2]